MDWNCKEYCVESHKVTTEDGYIIAMFRVVERQLKLNYTDCLVKEKIELENDLETKDGGKSVIRRPSILLVHGFLGSSEQWFRNTSPETCLPFLLSKAGYDCWLIDLRGSNLSKSHVNLKPNMKKFWDFGIDQMACFDLPSVIDYILETTQNQRLFYIGHSMGCTVFFIMAACKPEWCSKIRAMIALAPAAYGKHCRSKSIKIGAFFMPSMGKLRAVQKAELFPNPCIEITSKFCPPFCKNENLAKNLTKMAMSYGLAYKDELNKEQMKMFSNIFPCTTSGKVLCHGMQIIKAFKFQQYDYGRTKNLKMYGQISPPLYDLEKVKVPIALFHSEGDKIITPRDVSVLAEMLPQVFFDNRIAKSKRFSHLSFMVRKEAVEVVYEPIIEILNGFM